MCRVLKIHPSGYYRWLRAPQSKRSKENEKLLVQIREVWNDSGKSYGSPKIYRELREDGHRCSLNRIARIMKVAKIKAVRTYRKHPYIHSLPSNLHPNHLNREF